MKQKEKMTRKTEFQPFAINQLKLIEKRLYMAEGVNCDKNRLAGG